MRILLLGEYSNLHNTLAQGFRSLGHEVCVASGGDGWKNYPRDIDLSRSNRSKWGGIKLKLKLQMTMPKFEDYDVVQIINPVFLNLKAERIAPYYRRLRERNGKMVMGAFGMDYYWCKVNRDEKPMRYSDFNFGNEIREDEQARLYLNEWMDTEKGRLNQMIAHDCDAIVSGLYEYWVCYQQFADKMRYIPMPIRMPEGTEKRLRDNDFRVGEKVRLFIGISKNRSAYKGTDIMLRAAEKVCDLHPDKVELCVVEGVPFDRYQQLMDGSDAILDQLYSYTPAMNSLLAMSKGIINIGGGEPEHYELLGENELRPIINVEPNYESVVHELEQLVLNKERIPELKRQSVEYVLRHHEYRKVAQRYVDFYKSI